MCSKIALYWSLCSIVCGSQTWVIVVLRASPNSRFEPIRQLHVTFISLWWFLLNQLPRNSGCSYASNASKVADNIKMERSCNMLIVKEEVLRISNVLKLFLWNIGVIIDRSFLLNKYVLYIQLFVLVSPDCRTLWDYELNWFDFFLSRKLIWINFEWWVYEGRGRTYICDLISVLKTIYMNHFVLVFSM